MSADQKFWLRIWSLVMIVAVASCVTAIICTQFAHQQIQHSKQACFASGQSWVNGNCLPLRGAKR